MEAANLINLTLTELSAAIAKSAVTPVQVLRAYLDRIDAVEPRVEAWCYLDREGAMAAAEALTREAAAGKLRSPLHGIPAGFKDEFHVAGMPTYMTGDDRPQPEDATPVARLREAGAVVLGKTHMPIDGKLPPTRNPWNLAHTAGGTSSGSGASVAARMAPYGLGEQSYGSGLRPAAYVGIAGLKPTFGRVSRFGCYQFTYSHDHPVIHALTMEDIALVLSIIAGPDPRDPTTRPEPAPPAALPVDGMRPPTIGVVRNIFPERTGPLVQETLDRAAAQLQAAGARLVDVRLPDEFEMVWMVHRVISQAEGFTFRSRRYATMPDHMTSAQDIASSLIPASYYLQAQRIRRHMQDSFNTVFSGIDALYMATAPAPAPEGLETTGDFTLLIPWSCMGFPAITLNGGLSPQGLPIGLQFVAPPMADHQLLTLGAWCERVLGRLGLPPIR